MRVREFVHMQGWGRERVGACSRALAHTRACACTQGPACAPVHVFLSLSLSRARSRSLARSLALARARARSLSPPHPPLLSHAGRNRGEGAEKKRPIYMLKETVERARKRAI